MLNRNRYSKGKKRTMTQREFEDFHNYNIEANSTERERK